MEARRGRIGSIFPIATHATIRHESQITHTQDQEKMKRDPVTFEVTEPNPATYIATEIHDMRQRGWSWAHIAARFGKNELDLRRTYDHAAPANIIEFAPVRETPIAPPEPPEPPRRKITHRVMNPVRQKPIKDKTAMGRAMLALSTQNLTSSEMLLRGEWTDINSIRAAMGSLVRKNYAKPIRNEHPSRWTLTPAGKDALKHITGAPA